METLTFELKAADGDSGPGTFEGVMSVPVLDRDGEIVDSHCFDPLPKHITIDIDHGLTVEKTVGSGEPYYDRDGILKVKGTFASTPLGQVARTLVKEGHIRHMSVVFMNPVREVDSKDGKQHVRKGQLVNCTITGIPANTSTLVTAKVGARNSSSDMKRIQAAHDAMVEMGAACDGKHVHATDQKGLLDDIINADVVDLTDSTDTETPDSGPASAAPESGADVEVGKSLYERASAIAARAKAQLLLNE